MGNSTGLYPRVVTDAAGSGVVSRAGAVLLADTIGAAGIDRTLSGALERWRRPTAVHDPAKSLLDPGVTRGVTRDVAAIASPTSPHCARRPRCSGPVALDPTVSRLIATLAGDAEAALAAIDTARAAAGKTVWTPAGAHAPDPGVDHRSPLVVDVDATLVTAHSDKQAAAPTFNRGCGHHPLGAFVDHGQAGSGGPVADAAAARQRRLEHRR